MLRKVINWFKLTDAKKSFIFLTILYTCIRVTAFIISPIFAARVTVALTTGEYAYAIQNLTIELAIVVGGYLCWDLVYRNSGLIFRNIYNNVQKKIYQKAYRAKVSNFKVTSKEKLLNIIGTDIDVVAMFGDNLGTKIGRIIQVVVTMAIVFVSNIMVGFFILLVSALNFVILLILNKKIANRKSYVYDKRDKIYESFSQLLTDQDVIKEFDMGPQYANKYFKNSEKYANSWVMHKKACSLKDNYFVGFYKIMIFIITVFMIFLVKDGVLDLTLYFTLVPYLLTCVELINEIINLSAGIEEMDVSAKRINTIINFTDEEFVKYGNITQYPHSDNYNFMGVSYKNTDTESPFFGEIKNMDLSFKYGCLNVVKGDRGSGKRVIFNLMSRRISPNSGKIMMNDIDIYEYDKYAYKTEVFNAFSKPKFIDASILKNFSVADGNIDRIQEVCEMLGILDKIKALPSGFDTNINDVKFDGYDMFLLGLAMSYLHRSTLLCIYQLPQGMTTKQVKSLKEIFSKILMDRTLLVFTHLNSLDDVAGLIYTIKKGEVVDRVEK